MGLNKNIEKELMKENSYIDMIISSLYFFIMARHLSAYNSLLLLVQSFGALWVETEDSWKKLGFQPKPHAKKIALLVPNGPIAFYYDIESVDPCGTIDYEMIRKKRNKRVLYEILTEGITDKRSYIRTSPIPVDDATFSRYVERLKKNHFYYLEDSMGAEQRGELVYRQNPLQYTYENKAIDTHYTVVVSSNLTNDEKLATIFHELGHFFCAHVPMDKKHPMAKKLCDRNFNIDTGDKELDSIKIQNQKEYEAETVCQFVCARLGVGSYNKKYLEYYGNPDGTTVEPNLQIVATAVDSIVKMLTGSEKKDKSGKD